MLDRCHAGTHALRNSRTPSTPITKSPGVWIEAVGGGRGEKCGELSLMRLARFYTSMRVAKRNHLLLQLSVRAGCTPSRPLAGARRTLASLPKKVKSLDEQSRNYHNRPREQTENTESLSLFAWSA